MILDNVGFFELARTASLESNCRVKVGCVIVRCGNPIIARSNRRVISHPTFARLGDDFRNSLHAEIRAIMNLWDINNLVAFVYREAKRSDGFIYPAIAKPCSVCLEALREKNIKKIYYTISYPPYYVWERI